MKKSLTNPFVVMWIVLIMYVAKAAFKIGIGSMLHSPMIEGDGFHNIADLFEAVAIIVVLFISKRPNSVDYPYGKRNIEFFASLLIGASLILLSVRFVLASVVGILSTIPSTAGIPAQFSWLPVHEPVVVTADSFPWAAGITLVSVVLSIVISRYQIAVGKSTGHVSLIADGEETASDGRLEAVTLAGVLAEHFLSSNWFGMSLGFLVPWVEYTLGLLVAALIARTGFTLFRSAMQVLLQRSLGEDHQLRINEICMETPGIEAVTSIRTFRIGHTAVCLASMITRHNRPTIQHIKYGLEQALREYLLSHDFKDADIHLKFAYPEPERHRIAYALTRADDGLLYISPGLSEATNLLICDMEHNTVVRATEEPMPLDVVALLKLKRVREVFLFAPGPEDHAKLEGSSISVRASVSYVPTVMGLDLK